MSAQVYYSPFIPAFGGNGAPVPGAKLYFYQTQTDTLRPIYSDSSMTTLLPNPVEADLSAKFPNIFLDSSVVYRVRITGPTGIPLGDDIDPYIPGQALVGQAGPSNNTRLTLAELKAAEISDQTSLYKDSLWVWDEGATANGINQIASNDSVTGAWVDTNEVYNRQYTISFELFKANNGHPLSDIDTLAAILNYINANGHINPAYCTGFCVIMPNRLVDWLAITTLPSVLVSNVTFKASESTYIIVRDGVPWTLGQAGDPPIENFRIQNLSFLVPFETPAAANQALLCPVNCARVYIDHVAVSRVRHMYKTTIPAGCVVANIYLRNCSGFLVPDSNPIEVVNTAGGRFIDWRLLWCDFVPLANPTNPAIVPVSVTGVLKGATTVITASNHGFAVGARVRIRDLGGTTQLNGNDYTVTEADASNFRIAVDSTTFGDFAGGGYAVERHLSYQYNSAVVSIEGQYDTGYIVGGVYLHWNRLWNFKVSGVMAYLFVWHVDCDYMGTSLGNFEMAGGVFAVGQVLGGWVSTYDGPTITATRSGSGSVLGFDVDGVRVGFSGAGLLDDPQGVFKSWSFTNIRVNSLNRIQSGAKYMFNVQNAATTSVTISDLTMDDPGDYFPGTTASTSMIPTVGFSNTYGSTNVTIQNCLFRASTVCYGITYGTGQPTLTGNRCANGALPEYTAVTTPTVGASPYTWTNNLGTLANVILKDGTISVITLSQAGSNPEISTGSNGILLVGRGQSLTITYSAAPTLKVLPVNV